jgi:hypothetical protein
MKLKGHTGLTPIQSKIPGKRPRESNKEDIGKQDGKAQKGEKAVPQSNKKKKKGGRTKKLARIMRALKKTYPAFLERNPICRIQSPICTQVATVVNHEKGRGINVVMNPKYWTPCCPACNGYIEVHDKWAQERGFKKSRLAIEGPEENNSENIC